MKHVYTIESGEYSDFRVYAIAADKATADQWVDQMNRAEPDRCYPYTSEPMLLISPDDPCVQIVTYRRQATLWDNGTITRDWTQEEQNYLPEVNPWCMLDQPTVRFVRAPIYKDAGGRLEVYGRDLNEVNQVFNDRIDSWQGGTWDTKVEIHP